MARVTNRVNRISVMVNVQCLWDVVINMNSSVDSKNMLVAN